MCCWQLVSQQLCHSAIRPCLLLLSRCVLSPSPCRCSALADRLHLLALSDLGLAGTSIACSAGTAVTQKHRNVDERQFGLGAAHTAVVWAVCPALLWLVLQLMWGSASRPCPATSSCTTPLTESPFLGQSQVCSFVLQSVCFQCTELCPVEASCWPLGYPDLERAIVAGQAVVDAGADKGADAPLRDLRRLQPRLEARGLTMQFVRGDGNCLVRRLC